MHLHRHVWSHNASAEALRIVRNVIYNSQKPLTARDVYRLALQEPSTNTDKNPVKHTKNSEQVIKHNGPVPPNAEHPVRSMSYLKNAVLPVLASQNEIQKVHTSVTLTPEELEARLQDMDKSTRRTANLQSVQQVWAWKPKTPQNPPAPKPEVAVFGTEVGVGEDWSHLNKRRRRAREASMARDIRWLRELEKVRTEALSESTS